MSSMSSDWRMLTDKCNLLAEKIFGMCVMYLLLNAIIRKYNEEVVIAK
jgi:hypothetical protein